jgi:hypothetical protein
MAQELRWIEFKNHINYLFSKIDNDQFTAQDYMYGYNLCYNLLTNRDSYEYINKMYKQYILSLSSYAINDIFPKLQQKTGYQLMVELDISYTKFNKISCRLIDIMMRLDKYVNYHSLISLKDLSKGIFKEYVYKLLISSDAFKSNIDNNIFNDHHLNKELLIIYNDMKIDYKLPKDNIINQQFIIEI